MLLSSAQIDSAEPWLSHLRKSRPANRVDSLSSAGTPGFCAPETSTGTLSSASDVFSFGMIAYSLATGLRPFQDQLDGHVSPSEHIQKLLAQGQRPTVPSGNSEQWQTRLLDLAVQCWAQNAADRPTINDIKL